VSPKFSQFLAHFPLFSFYSFSYPFLSTPSPIPGPPVDLRGVLACAPIQFPSPSVRCQPRVAGAPDLEGRSPTTSPTSRTQQLQVARSRALRGLGASAYSSGAVYQCSSMHRNVLSSNLEPGAQRGGVVDQQASGVAMCATATATPPHHHCYRRHLHQSRGRLGAWVSRGNRPQKETLGSVSMYPPVLVTRLVDVIVCAPLPPLLPLDDAPMTSTYVCVFWTLVSPPDDALYE
jgi:hypothetical protein